MAVSCAIFYVLVMGLPLGHGGRTGMLVLLSFLACIEKLCSILNLVSVEKDWVSRLITRQTSWTFSSSDR